MIEGIILFWMLYKLNAPTWLYVLDAIIIALSVWKFGIGFKKGLKSRHG